MANIFQKIKRKHKRKKMMAQKARKQTEDDYQTKLIHHRHAVLKRTFLTGAAVVVVIGLIVFYVEKRSYHSYKVIQTSEQEDVVSTKYEEMSGKMNMTEVLQTNL